MQDILGLCSEAKMNFQGTTEGNWCWRFLSQMLTDEIKDRLKKGIVEGDEQLTVEAAQEAIKAGFNPMEAIDYAALGKRLSDFVEYVDSGKFARSVAEGNARLAVKTLSSAEFVRKVSEIAVGNLLHRRIDESPRLLRRLSEYLLDYR